MIKIAVLLPCYNEGGAIANVIASFERALPQAEIYVFDNNSTDETSRIAKDAGATVCFESRKGKGNVIRRMFSDIEADIYVMADGDGTYDADAAPKLIQSLIESGADMVVGTRSEDYGEQLYRKGHRFGNRMLNLMVQMLFSRGVSDMLSGYRVFSRRFVKSFPAISRGFETETELTIHALQMRLPIIEVPTRYFDRAEGTESKLSTYKDGARIASFIIFFFKEAKPFAFFGVLSFALAILSIVIGLPVIFEYFETGLVPRFPTAILSTGIMVVAVLSFVCGTILDTISRGRIEQKRLAYLSIPKVKG